MKAIVLLEIYHVKNGTSRVERWRICRGMKFHAFRIEVETTEKNEHEDTLESLIQQLLEEMTQ